MKLKKGIRRFLTLLFIILVGVGIYFYLTYGETKKPKVKVVSSIPGYGYKLSNNKSKEYKKLFAKLKKILDEDPVDEKKYVKTISKMFIVDFYSLSDKVAKTDVGGVDFVHKDEKTDFLEKAQDTMYKYLENNLYGGRNQKLPSVKKVTIEKVSQDKFEYGETSDEEAYIVDCSWEYKEGSPSGYQDEAKLTFVHEGKKLSLVELK